MRRYLPALALLVVLPLTTAAECEGTAASSSDPSPKMTVDRAGIVHDRLSRSAARKYIKVRLPGGRVTDWGKVRRSTYNDCQVGDPWPKCRED